MPSRNNEMSFRYDEMAFRCDEMASLIYKETINMSIKQ